MPFHTRCCAAIAAAAVLLLSACGGGGGGSSAGAQPTPTPTPTPTPLFSIGGGIGLLGNARGLTLVNGAETLAIAPNATSFTFANKLSQNASYNVAIGQQPAGLVCSVNNGSGTVALDNVRTVVVLCYAAQDSAGYNVSTFAGDDGQTLVDGVGPSARFGSPYAIVKDSVGNFYVSDTQSNAIRRVSPTGVVSTVALLGSSPKGMAMDDADNLYVADSANARVLKITPRGDVSTYAGGAGNPGYVDGAASLARFSSPQGVAVDHAGNVYVSESQGFFEGIRKIAPSGVVSTLAGYGAAGFADGDGTAARFGAAGQLVLDGTGNLYVADNGNIAVRKVTPSGTVTTVIGGPGAYGTANVDGVGSAARFGSILGIALDSAGNIYVADLLHNSIRKVTPGAMVSTVAGAVVNGTGGLSGFVDGNGATARFSGPTSMVVDAVGNVQVVDSLNRAIRTVTPAGVVTTLAGQGPAVSVVDGIGTAARFYPLTGIAADAAGSLYAAEGPNAPIRKISPAGVVTTTASGPLGDGFTSRNGVAVDAVGNVYFTTSTGVKKMSPAGVVSNVLQVPNPAGVAVDGAGTVYVTSGNAVVAMTAGGVVSTLAGSDSAGFVDGAGSVARFYAPSGIAVDTGGNVYVADTYNSAIRKISPQGQVTSLPSGGFSGPTSLTVDAQGNVYVVTDTHLGGDSRVSYPAFGGAVIKIASNGIVTTLAGSPSDVSGRTDGPAATARFNVPTGIALDGAGNLYVADGSNNAIRKISH